MQDTTRLVAALAMLFAAGGCATSAPAGPPRAPVPVFDQRELEGCTWEQVGTVSTEDRSAVFSPSADELRLALARRGASMNADAVVDFKTMRVGAVRVRGTTAGERAAAVTRATGLAVRFTSPGCPTGGTP